ARTSPNGETMTLPPRMSTVLGSFPCTASYSAGQSARVRYWQALSTNIRPLVRDVTHAGLPDLAVVHGWGAPQLDVVCIGCEPELRHVVLPADGCSEAAGR